jgi:hypothetical protein
MKEAFVKPREGLIVRYPISKAVLPVNGIIVPLAGKEGTYWKRRLACGDVYIADETPIAAEVKDKFKKKEV